MARRAKKDAIVREPVGLVEGDESYVNRKVFAGDQVPDNWIFENDGDVEETEGSNMVAGLGAAPHAYKSQLDDSGQIKDEHKPEQQRGRGRGRKSEKDEAEVEAPAHVTAPKSKS